MEVKWRRWSLVGAGVGRQLERRFGETCTPDSGPCRRDPRPCLPSGQAPVEQLPLPIPPYDFLNADLTDAALTLGRILKSLQPARVPDWEPVEYI